MENKYFYKNSDLEDHFIHCNCEKPNNPGGLYKNSQHLSWGCKKMQSYFILFCCKTSMGVHLVCKNAHIVFALLSEDHMAGGSGSSTQTQNHNNPKVIFISIFSNQYAPVLRENALSKIDPHKKFL